mgnify:CR=1 FL=1
MIGRPTPVTCLISDGSLSPENFNACNSTLLWRIQIAVNAGVSIVQIREKQIPARMLFDLAVEAVRLVKGSETLLLINDRADVAAAAGAHGVHLTGMSLGADQIRCTFGERFVIGVSTHSADDVLRAKGAGADLAVFGPVFPTPGKGPDVGVDTLASVCKAAGEFPVLALGGINADNWRRAVSAGAAGFAAIRYFAEFNNAAELADALRK